MRDGTRKNILWLWLLRSLLLFLPSFLREIVNTDYRKVSIDNDKAAVDDDSEEIIIKKNPVKIMKSIMDSAVSGTRDILVLRVRSCV